MSPASLSEDSRDRLTDEICKEARLYSGKNIVDTNQKIAEDLGIDDLDFYDFLENLSNRFGVDLLKKLEIRPRREIKPWSIPSIISAFRQPGLVEDPTLERLIELIDNQRRAQGE